MIGIGVALVLSRQHQEHRQDAQGEDHHRQGSSLHFFAGDAGPVVTKSLVTALAEHLLHRPDRLAGTVALLGSALDLDRAVEVEVGNDAGPHRLLHGEELREGNLLALGIGDVDRRQVSAVWHG